MLIDRSPEQSDIETNLIRLARAEGTKVTRALNGQSWQEGNASFSIIQAIEDEEENNGSIVIRANLGGFQWLFTGDLEEAGEKGLIFSDLLRKVDILKVGIMAVNHLVL
ncbi:hypothetical protein ABFG93_18665 [Pseudalkalibacillus hwajinpoensis]|uniref:hypothetical protein n=1 Tax=Guptibacillus hwajinpoensis TaxID=208199 RepID=UPI00325AAE2F